jgi:hypothetical protein
MCEYLLGDGCVCGSAGPSEVVERYAEPFIYAFVESMEVIADGTRGTALFQCFYLSGSTVLVSPADV